MNPTKTAFLSLLLGLCSFFSSAQMRHYHTQNYMEELAETDTQLSANRLILELATQEYIHSQNPQVATIPIVFHILYANTDEQLSIEQVQSQLDALNSAFAMAAPIASMSNDPYDRYMERAAHTDIQFCYPALDPLGNPTSGINYVPVAANLSDNLEDIKQVTTGASPWDIDHYLNIWVCHLPNSISGYAQMPGGAAATDGIVIDYRYFGTTTNVQMPYNLGHTLTHLVGNYLNLYPLWGFEKCGSDRVTDTPTHNAPNASTINAFSFTGDCVPYQHVSTCTGYPVEMTMNFMDNSGDACMYMFTKGQRKRMHATLNVIGGRTLLTTPATNCTPTLKEEESAISYRSESTSESPLPNETQVFPNPTTEILNVVVSSSLVHPSTWIEVYSVQGQLKYRSPKGVFAASTFSLKVADWTTGIYFIQVKNENDLLTRKFSIE